MPFYNIGRTNDIKVIGHYPQTTRLKSYPAYADDYASRILPNSFPKFEPKYGLELHENSIPTDILDSDNLSFGMIVSDRFKSILINHKLPPHRFYPVDVVGTSVDYYWFHYITEIERFLDYTETEIEVYRNRPPFNVEEIKIFSSPEDIMNFKKSLPYNKAIRFKKIQLKNDFPGYDIFEITGAQYFTLVSGKLRDELIKHNITGLEIVKYDKLKWRNS